MKRYTLEYLQSLPTLSTGQTCDLKLEFGSFPFFRRVWLARTTVDDGEPYDNKVTIEELREGRWVTIDVYDPARINEMDPLP